MPPSGNAQKIAKRSMSLDHSLIAGLVVVVVALNAILALTFCLFRNRRRRRTHKRHISAPLDCEKYETSVAFAVTTGALPATIPAVATGATEHKSYYDLIQALQRQSGPPPLTGQSRGLSRSSVHSSYLSNTLPPLQVGTEFHGVSIKAKGRVEVLRQSATFASSDGPSLTRSNSLAETSSVYSSASAPMEYHERLFRAQALTLPPLPVARAAAPAWVAELPDPPPPATLYHEHTEKTSTSSFTALTASRRGVIATNRRPSKPDVPTTPTISPTSTRTPNSPRSRALATPASSPPQVRWLSDGIDAKSSSRPRRTSSTSSISAAFSAHILHSDPLGSRVPVAPLNISRKSQSSRWSSIEREASFESQPSEARSAVPNIPVRSPRRPPPSALDE
ncbi:hypothetical protein BD413DRAFT_283902 [Trametes elegans]|nr:hypothetical protein BD413DRAFT_283902 [Trametes elegans]